MFDGLKKVEKKIDEEKGYIWDEINKINSKILSQQAAVDKISKSAPEHFKELQASAKDASYYRNRAQEKFDSTADSVIKVSEIQGKIEVLYSDAKEHAGYIGEQKEKLMKILHDMEAYEEKIYESKESIANNILTLDGLVAQKNELEESVNDINAFSEEVKETDGKVKSLMSGFVRDRSEIRELHKKIFGYKSDTENEDGELQYIDGLSDELESSYESIKNKLGILGGSVAEAETELESSLSKSKDDAGRSFNEYVESCTTQQNEVMEQIRSLLPKALTAGLAGAYEEKITREETQLLKHDKSFNLSIIGLALCSLIPISFNIYRLFGDDSLTVILKDTPVIIAIMLPLYMPILWVAYSSSKKYKLSKRLIEEYTHKGVLSKTFEGLSKQVHDIKEDDINKELRNKLLYNLIHVNSENPGKLISDYQKSDHPLMETVDTGTRVVESLSKSEGIPIVSSGVKKVSDVASGIVDAVKDKS